MRKYPGKVPEHLSHYPSFWNHRQIKQLELENAKSQYSDGSRVASYPDQDSALPDKYRAPLSKGPGQTLYKAEKEDIAILSESDRLYVHPFQCENSTVLRVVRMSDPVTTPIYRAIRNSHYGMFKYL